MKKRIVSLTLLVFLIGNMFIVPVSSAAHTHQYKIVGGGSQTIDITHEFWYHFAYGSDSHMRCAATETHSSVRYECSCGAYEFTTSVTYNHPNPYCSSH
jgi:hypothetical protein